MRTIKFRSWDKKDKLMRDRIPGRWWVGMDIETGDLVNHIEGKLVDVPKDRLIIMQFTGLHDRNGKEIYEGDIIKVLRGYSGDDNRIDEHIAEVFWDDDGWYAYDLTDDRWKGVEVIGNIYENPELLNQ